MKKHMYIGIAIIAVILAVPFIADAAGLTRGFGGRITATSIPDVTCTNTGPTVLSRINGLPLYTTNTQKTPKAGDWILGKVNIIPEFTSCQIQIGTYKIPFPVRDTSNYNLSGSTRSSF